MRKVSQDIWIIGFGRFGQLALQRLLHRNNVSRVLVVDTAVQPLVQDYPDIDFVSEEGVEFLSNHLSPECLPQWIVPAVPLHLAAEWSLATIGPSHTQRIELPLGIEEYVPSLMQGPKGDAYLSLATFKCPDDCPEPADYCTATKERRKENLFDILKRMRIKGYKPLVLRSHQLAPGVGGCKATELIQVQKALLQSKGKYLLSTACRCHGVVTPIKSYA